MRLLSAPLARFHEVVVLMLYVNSNFRQLRWALDLVSAVSAYYIEPKHYPNSGKIKQIQIVKLSRYFADLNSLSIYGSGGIHVQFA